MARKRNPHETGRRWRTLLTRLERSGRCVAIFVGRQAARGVDADDRSSTGWFAEPTVALPSRLPLPQCSILGLAPSGRRSSSGGVPRRTIDSGEKAACLFRWNRHGPKSGRSRRSVRFFVILTTRTSRRKPVDIGMDGRKMELEGQKCRAKWSL